MRGRAQNGLHTAALRTRACPVCGSAVGVPCRKVKGGIAWPPHKARIDSASVSPAANSPQTPDQPKGI